MVILGIDPGYAIVGYGVLEYRGSRFSVLDYGAVTTEAHTPFPDRLERIYADLNALMQKWRPQAMAIEKLFYNTNAKTVIDVAQARGVTVLAAIAGGVLCGVSLGGTLLTNSSAGGTDIIGKIAYEKNPDVNVQWQIFIFDSLVVLLSGAIGLINIEGQDANTIFTNVATPIFYSFITLFVTSEIADVVTNGLQSSVVFNIVTSKPDELSAAIVSKLHRGATKYTGEGVYTHAERYILVCVVKRRQSTHLKKIIKGIDPNSFVYITKAKEVNGFGFRSGN